MNKMSPERTALLTHGCAKGVVGSSPNPPKKPPLFLEFNAVNGGLIEECAAFPNGEYDDLVDSTTQALMRYRQGNFVQLPTDYQDDEPRPVKFEAYYG